MPETGIPSRKKSHFLGVERLENVLFIAGMLQECLFMDGKVVDAAAVLYKKTSAVHRCERTHSRRIINPCFNSDVSLPTNTKLIS